MWIILVMTRYSTFHVLIMVGTMIVMSQQTLQRVEGILVHCIQYSLAIPHYHRRMEMFLQVGNVSTSGETEALPTFSS